MADEKLEFNFKSTKLAKIPLAKIRENAIALRKVVNKETEEYMSGLDSVKKRGIMIPILVRPIKDPVTGEDLYGLIDGLHRLNWAMDASLEEIPANIGDLDEANILEAQILANVHKIETKPVQYTKALVTVVGQNPLLTLTELAGRLSRSEKWITDRLGLLDLTEDIQKLVDEGKLVLTNAYALSKLPEDHQRDNLNAAMSQSPAEFIPRMQTLQKEIDKARREGRKAETEHFMPSPRLQRLPLIKDEAALAKDKPADCKVIQMAAQAGCKTMEQGVAFALNWTIHNDPITLKAEEAKWKAEKEQKEKDKAERAKQRELDKAKKLAEKAQAEGTATPAPAAAPAG